MSELEKEMAEARKLVEQKHATARCAYAATGVAFRIFARVLEGDIAANKPAEVKKFHKLLAWLRTVPPEQASVPRGRRSTKDEQASSATMTAAADLASAVAVHLAILHSKPVVDAQIADTAYCLAQALGRLAACLPQETRDRIAPLVAATTARHLDAANK